MVSLGWSKMVFGGLSALFFFDFLEGRSAGRKVGRCVGKRKKIYDS
jgi:hypothetical protein